MTSDGQADAPVVEERWFPPAVAGAMMTPDGIVTAHTSAKGDIAPSFHPFIRGLLEHLSTNARERYTGWCAEAILISDRLYGLDRSRPEPLTAAEAQQALREARIVTTRIRELGDPTHGAHQPPCRTCAALLAWFGIVAASP